MARIARNIEGSIGVAGYRFFEFIGERLRFDYKHCQMAKLLFLRLID